MTLPDPAVPLNPGHVDDNVVEDEILPPVTPDPGAQAEDADSVDD